MGSGSLNLLNYLHYPAFRGLLPDTHPHDYVAYPGFFQYLLRSLPLGDQIAALKDLLVEFRFGPNEGTGPPGPKVCHVREVYVLA